MKTNMATQHCQKTKLYFSFVVYSLKGYLPSSPVSKLSQEEIMKSSHFQGIRTGLNHVNYFCQVFSIKTHCEINGYHWANRPSTHSPHRTETVTHWLLQPHSCKLICESRLGAGHCISVKSSAAESSRLSTAASHTLQSCLLAASSVLE